MRAQLTMYAKRSAVYVQTPLLRLIATDRLKVLSHQIWHGTARHGTVHRGAVRRRSAMQCT